MRSRSALAAAALAIAALGLDPAVAQDVEVERKGKYRIWYTSPDLRVELDYHWADRHLGDEHLILKLAMAAGSRGVVSVARDAVQVQTPEGHVLSLPTQDEFRRMLGKVRVALERENAWGPPASRFSGSLGRSAEWFYSPPGAYFDRNTVFPSPAQYCSGPLVFLVPGGVQPGGWVLSLDLEESTARIPFVLGEER